LFVDIRKTVLFGDGSEVKEENDFFSNKVISVSVPVLFISRQRNQEKPWSDWTVPAKIQTRLLPTLYVFLFHTVTSKIN
jgi:hypothetical protein